MSIKTKAHALHLLTLAQARLVKEQEAVTATQTAIVNYTELVKTLPEAPAASIKVAVAVGTAINFNFGRAESRVVKAGVVEARKDGEDGQPELYKVRVGEGFDAELYKVYPGQIIGADTPADDTLDADPLA